MGKGFRPTWVLQTPLTPWPPQARSVLEEGLWDAMRKYGEDQPVTEAVDEIQRDVSNGGAPYRTGLGQWGSPPLTPWGVCVPAPPQFQCCGANNYTDWSSIERFRANDTVPRSCCRSNATSCNVHPTPETVYEKVRPPRVPPAVVRGGLAPPEPLYPLPPRAASKRSKPG